MSKPAAASSIPKNRVLASKEATLFKTVLQLYESRQWKRGLKTTEQILKKYPDHGETLSMKGLILTNMARKEEGMELVRKGVRMDLTSHICWHVFGLVHKADRNYEEALKCYTQALRIEKENLNLLRDFAHLQMQLRHYDGLVETRQTLLKFRPNVRSNWAAMAVAYHLNGQLDSAHKVLEQYEKTVKNVPDYDPEYSELLLYHVHVLYDMESWEDALSLLDTNARSRSITDRTAISVLRARILHKLGRTEESQAVWVSLIEANTECYDYYKGYLYTQNVDLDALSGDSHDHAVTTLKGFAEQYPKSAAPRRILLGLTSGDGFKGLVEPYLIRGLSRGIPSLFADIKDLYSAPEKRQVIEDIVEGVRSRLEKGESLTDSLISQDPTVYVWTLYFLVQHYAVSSQTIPRALVLVETAISHTPTLPELYMAKARTLKRAGDPLGAAATMANAWRLDLQDRFLNTKYAKYLFKAGLIDEGIKILGLFTKKAAVSPGADLEDMQSLFYSLEEGDAQNRLGRLNLALKRYYGVFKTFGDIEDDQYDFHSFALRKYTLTSYLQFMDMEDTLRSHPGYGRAALAAAKIYVRVYDNPKLASPTAGLTEAQKKAAKKAKKAELKQLEDAKKAVVTPAGEDASEAAILKDDDPEGLKLLLVADPLEQAAKILTPLHQLQPHILDTWLVTYDVSIRRKKYLLAIKSLNHARSIDADSPEVHVRLVDLKTKAEALPSNLPSHIGSLLSSTLSDWIPSDQSLEAYNSAFSQKLPTSPQRLVAAARGLVHIRGVDSSRADAEELVFQLLRKEVDADIASSLDALSFLRETLGSSRTEEFRSASAARLPLSTVLKTDKDLADLQARLNFSPVDTRHDEEGSKSEEVAV